MVQYIDKDALVAEIERRIKINKECMLGLRNLDYYQGKVDALNDTLSFIDSMQEEPVSEDLEEAGKQYLERSNPDRVHQITNAFKAGAKWQKQQDTKILESIITNGKDYPTLDSFLNTFKMMQYGKIKM